MSNIKIELESVQVTNGQGKGEGDFELNIQVLESVLWSGYMSKVIWPSLNGTTKVNNNGSVMHIGQPVDTYHVPSRSYKNLLVIVTEEDTGTLGQDEVGQKTLTFELNHDMSDTSRTVLIDLKNQGGNEGQVLVTLSAREV